MTSGSIIVSKIQKLGRAKVTDVMGISGHSTSVHLHIRVKEIRGSTTRDIRTRLELNGCRNC